MTTSRAQHHSPADGMRFSRRLVLVALTVIAFLLTLWTSLRPNLDDGWLAIGLPNPLAGIAWFILFVALLLQVTSRLPAFALGISWLFFWPTPLYASTGVMALHGQFVMDRVDATITATEQGRARGPVPVTFTFKDGTSEQGISTLSERATSEYQYVVPRVGTKVAALRDPSGWLPARTAGERIGPTRSLLLALPGALGVVVLAGAAFSALTRRRSFVMDAAGQSTPAARGTDLSPGEEAAGRAARTPSA